MSPVTSSHPLRLGNVAYLNSRPFELAVPGMRDLGPRELALALHNHEVDLALVPVMECLQHPLYDLLDGVVIGARGDVFSVILTGDPADGLSLSLDGASLTSVNLLKVLCRKYWGVDVEFTESREADLRLIIGDPAIAFRSESPEAPVRDLAGEWMKATGLPFVFAAWAFHRDAEISQEILDAYRERFLEGVRRRGELVMGDMDQMYLFESIRYELTPEMKAGLERFRDDLVECGLTDCRAPLRYR